MSELKVVRFIHFSSMTDGCNRWSKTCLATVTTKGYRDVLQPSNSERKAEANTNIQICNDLTLSCQEDIIFGTINESVYKAFPDGDARFAWKKLQEKYDPRTGAAKV